MSEDKQYIVYGLICPIDNIVRYIGITCQSLGKRLQAHMCSKELENQYKYRWIQKLRSSNLRPTMKVLMSDLSEEEACKEEVRLIKEFREKCGEKLTNLHEGGNIPPSWSGKKHTPENVKKMSERVKGKNHPMYGVKGADNPRSRPVSQYDKDGNLIKKFVSAEFAKIETGIEHISDVCKGRLLSAGGYIWRYELDSFDKFENKNPWLLYQFDKKGNFLAKYFDCKHASERTGVDTSSISAVCLKKTVRKSAGGFIWRYQGDVKNNKMIEMPNYKVQL